MIHTIRQLPYSLILLLSLSSSSSALSGHSPQDLLANPKYSVVLSDQVLLNDSAAILLQEHQSVRSFPLPSPAASTSPTTADTHQQNKDAELDDDGVIPPAVHLLKTPAGQAFLCTVPAAADKPSKRPMSEDMTTRRAEREKGLERGLALLEPMKGGCLYQKQGWFTYSFCYGQEIRQFHEVRLQGAPGPSEDPNADSYTLGQSPSPVPATPKYGSGSVATSVRIPSTLGGGNEMGFGWEEGGRYLSQKWEGGTVCDKTGMPRTVEVQFHCSTQSTDRILLIREVAICSYVLLIHTPRLCVEPIFLEGHDSSQEPPSTIQCQPVVKKIREAVDPPPASTEGSDSPASEKDAPLHVPGSGSFTRDRRAEGSDPSNLGTIDLVDQQLLEESETAGRLVDQDQVGSLAGLDTVTLIYDPETGLITSAQTEDGKSLFDSDGTLVRTEKVPPSSGEKQDEDDDPHDLGAVKDLEELVKIMHQSITDALRQHSTKEHREDSGSDKDEPILTGNGVEVDGITGLLEAINRGVTGGVQKKEGAFGSLKEALKGDDRFTLKSVGSEEHNKLEEMFRKKFDDGDDGEEKKEASVPVRDEL